MVGWVSCIDNSLYVGQCQNDGRQGDEAGKDHDSDGDFGRGGRFGGHFTCQSRFIVIHNYLIIDRTHLA